MDLITSIEEHYKLIHKCRNEIAELKTKKAEKRNRYWGEATGIADQKKDYIKAMTGNIDEAIRKEEANIEYHYNMIEVLNMRLFEDE